MSLTVADRQAIAGVVRERIRALEAEHQRAWSRVYAAQDARAAARNVRDAESARVLERSEGALQGAIHHRELVELALERHRRLLGRLDAADLAAAGARAARELYGDPASPADLAAQRLEAAALAMEQAAAKLSGTVPGARAAERARAVLAHAAAASYEYEDLVHQLLVTDVTSGQAQTILDATMGSVART